MSLPAALPPCYDWLAADLAPGADLAAACDVQELAAWRVTGGDDPRFAAAFGALWREFGPAGEMEPERIIRARLARGAVAPRAGWRVLYELAAVEHAGRVVAVRDVNAIARTDGPAPCAVVHLSHVLVEPARRGGGLSAWLRALPLQTARRALASAGAPPDAPVVLVGEMEHPEPPEPARLHRLRSYGRAGFRAIAPAWLGYHQPDFREAAAIDAAGGARPLPMRLVVRRVGRETEPALPWSEVRATVEALYGMFALDYRWSDIAPLWTAFANAPRPVDESVPLVDPTSAM